MAFNIVMMTFGIIIVVRINIRLYLEIANL